MTPDRFSVITDGLPSQLPDIDPDETREWLESLDAVINDGRPQPGPLPDAPAAGAGPGAAGRRARRCAAPTTSTRSRRSASRGSPATSTSSAASAPTSGGTPRSWSSRANRPELGVGGHIATYASSRVSLYEVGFNHFFRGKDHGESGDQVFFQGHASPGIYARAFLEGRLTEAQLDGFRQELSHRRGGGPAVATRTRG